MSNQTGKIVYLDVGGQIFRTTKESLGRHGGYFQSLVNWEVNYDNEFGNGSKDSPFFIDRDPCTFSSILSYLRAGVIIWSSETDDYLRKLQLEANFYCLEDLTTSIEKELLERESKRDRSEFIYKVILTVEAEEFLASGWSYVDSCKSSQSVSCLSRGIAIPTRWVNNSCFACKESMSADKFQKHTIFYEQPMIVIRRSSGIHP